MNVPAGRNRQSGFFSQFVRAIYRYLSFSSIRLPSKYILKLTHRHVVPPTLDIVPAQKVLILAPHMDDETIGCGGAILLHVAGGASVDVMFVTNGAAGFTDQMCRQLTEVERVAIRRREAASACSKLGVSKTYFLDCPDGRSRVTEELLSKALTIFDLADPDLVYLPFVTDAHADHITTNHLFQSVIQRRSRHLSMLCCGYEVWSPLVANCVIDISSVVEEKMSALQCYTSQLEMNQYIRSIRGLNAYRSMSMGSDGYAEALYITDAKSYMRLVEAERQQC